MNIRAVLRGSGSGAYEEVRVRKMTPWTSVTCTDGGGRVCVCVSVYTRTPVHAWLLHVYLTKRRGANSVGRSLAASFVTFCVTLASYLTSMNFCCLICEMGIISISGGFS